MIFSLSFFYLSPKNFITISSIPEKFLAEIDKKNIISHKRLRPANPQNASSSSKHQELEIPTTPNDINSTNTQIIIDPISLSKIIAEQVAEAIKNMKHENIQSYDKKHTVPTQEPPIMPNNLQVR
ncbi:hypothetical protein GcM3_074022 [Golovinomyces cichoracearum]|uniref:Uncharacterized protein n=1 Tax=Golovinomyces cichoracearum TaxID=62708 RepID=A0A420IRF4_9PEZI|nr:hypothetical protein GcM3_074022 [Golovinomyces cichoracearum]